VVGFPSETEADFQILLDWLDEAELDRVGQTMTVLIDEVKITHSDEYDLWAEAIA
jgi:hypothetical protein